ncbi:beta-lactamase/transpeptidase-like protein [Xylaria bambusicola]|uniref:beta-lactamase/transpeptidase-like protein n=1 Tax=Xylaria bambusicola TaxID=326684 RepID=UPI0020085D90|nr:beta-lactamase/transpeptidase-like protein [Xylaria bambusicola]KAI0516859.1 beta-lactamase/transpeptidase-like protein [Xylaria bambusicola]
MTTIDKVYEEAVAAGLLPGASLIAGSINGETTFCQSFGRASLKEGVNRPFTDSTVCAVASMTKLMTSVAVLQCVEDGLLDLGKDARSLLPQIGTHGIITGFDDEGNTAILKPDSTPITLRMLLSHTSGHEYDWLSPLLGKWRASRNEGPWTGPTVEHKSALPLLFTPGTSFAYGAGHDWAGKAVEVATGTTLEDFMRARIWEPLGIAEDASFYPKTKEGMKARMADLSTLNDKGEPPAVDAPDFDILFGGTDCLGGAGVFITPKAYSIFVSAVSRRDAKLLKPASFDELFRPQLDETQEQALNDYVDQSPIHSRLLAMRIPQSIRKSWSFAGLIAKEGQEGRFGPGTVFWGGVPSTQWFIDRSTGIYGAAFCQTLPPMHPKILELHEKFQRDMYKLAITNSEQS